MVHGELRQSLGHTCLETKWMIKTTIFYTPGSKRLLIICVLDISSGDHISPSTCLTVNYVIYFSLSNESKPP